jgi:hypothetical protein
MAGDPLATRDQRTVFGGAGTGDDLACPNDKWQSKRVSKGAAAAIRTIPK